ncbi:MAG: Xaa-Pro peptidase family protein [Candidatus Micrarchaeota archaeon]|nr:Xaa-Pro peptidase family protein [Candidatus Micrarchaeota archaeon]
MDLLLERRKALFAGMDCESVLLASEGKSFLYFAGCEIDGCYLVLKKSGGVLLAPEMNFEAAKKESHYPVKRLGQKAAMAIKKECGGGRVGFHAGEMPSSKYLALLKKAKIRLVNVADKIGSIRGRKAPQEIEKIAQAAKAARLILDGLDPWEFATEQELAFNLKIAALKQGCEVAYEPIVASGKNSRFPHHRAGNSPLGKMVLVDFGVRKDGYCSDLSRCYFKESGREEQAYEKCKEALEEILGSLHSFEKGNELAAFAERLIRKKGLPKPIHAIGHGIGLEVHEFPSLGKKSKDPLQGSVLALEPAAYFGSFGVRHEEMVASTKEGWRKI